MSGHNQLHIYSNRPQNLEIHSILRLLDSSPRQRIMRSNNKPDSRDATAAIAKEITMAGPAWFLATSPVTT